MATRRTGVRTYQSLANASPEVQRMFGYVNPTAPSSNIHSQDMAQQTEAYNAGLDFLKQTNTQVMGLYQAAMQGYRDYGSTAIQEAKDLGTAQQASMKQDMIGSGIAGTTVMPSMAKGIMGRTGRTIGGILEERQAKIAGLQTAQAGAQLSAGANIASYMKDTPKPNYSYLLGQQQLAMEREKMTPILMGSGLGHKFYYSPQSGKFTTSYI